MVAIRPPVGPRAAAAPGRAAAAAQYSDSDSAEPGLNHSRVRASHLDALRAARVAACAREERAAPQCTGRASPRPPVAGLRAACPPHPIMGRPRIRRISARPALSVGPGLRACPPRPHPARGRAPRCAGGTHAHVSAPPTMCWGALRAARAAHARARVPLPPGLVSRAPRDWRTACLVFSGPRPSAPSAGSLRIALRAGLQRAREFGAGSLRDLPLKRAPRFKAALREYHWQKEQAK